MIVNRDPPKSRKPNHLSCERIYAGLAGLDGEELYIGTGKFIASSYAQIFLNPTEIRQLAYFMNRVVAWMDYREFKKNERKPHILKQRYKRGLK